MSNCPNCNKQFEDGVKFCDVCGTALAAAPAPEAAPVAAPEAAPAFKLPFELPFGLNKKTLGIGGAVLAAILVIAIIISSVFTATPSYFLYSKDGDVVYYDGSGKPWVAVEETDKPDNGFGSALLSADGKKIFYTQGGTLYYREVESKKEAVKLASNVGTFIINEKGSAVVYMSESSLYRHNLKDKTKIDSDVAGLSAITKDLKKVIYTKVETVEEKDEDGNVTGEKDVKDIYLATGKKTEKLETGVESFSVTEDLSVIYLIKDKTLYQKKGKKDKVKIASDVSYINNVYDDGMYYTTFEEIEKEDGYKDTLSTLFYYNGKKSEKLAEDFETLAYASKKPVMAYGVRNEVKDENGYVKDVEYDYFVAVEGKALELDMKVADVTFDENGKIVYFLEAVDGEEQMKAQENGDRVVSDLYRIKISGKKLGKAEKIDEDVDYETGIRLNVKSGNYWYFKDYNNENATATLYFKGKEVASDVVVDNVSYNAKANAFAFYTDMEEGVKGATLWVSKAGKKPIKIADGVASKAFDAKGNLAYLKDKSESNGKSDLYYNTLSKKSKKIDEDVLSVRVGTCISEYWD